MASTCAAERTRLQAGVVPQTAVLQAEDALSQAPTVLLSLRRQREVVLARLALVLGQALA